MGGIETAAARRVSTGRLFGWLAFVAVLATLNYVARFTTDPPEERDTLYQWSSFVGGVFLFGIILGITIALAARGPARTLLALRLPRKGWARALGLAAALLVATFAAAALLEPFLEAGEEQGLTPEGWDPDRAAPFFANALLVGALVPIVEELSFRGLGFSLLSSLGRWPAIVAVGVLFGLAHGLVNALPLLALFGMALAWLRDRTDSVFPCIVLHAAFNSLALIASVTVAGGT